MFSATDPRITEADFARELDAHDPLQRFRAEFVDEEPGLIYLDGNSLGRLPRRTAAHLETVIHQAWGRRLIRSWGEGWLTAPQRIGAQIAPLIGAQADEVLVTDSVSVNFFKLILAAVRARPGRHTLLTDDLNFPSDLYLLQGIVDLLGPPYRLEVIPSADGLTPPTEGLLAAMGPDTAVVTLTHVAFKSGYMYDLAAFTEAAHQAGAWMVWDLSHSVGAVPVALNAAGAELAVGCTYKYLNGGPGAPAFLYARRDLHAQLNNPLWGWFGQRDQFAMGPTYAPAPGIQRFLVGTPSQLALAAIEPSVALMLEAGIDQLRGKSVRQTEYLIALWERWLEPLGVRLNSPRAAEHRGSHVSLGHPEGLRIDRALIEEMNVIPDFRYPDNLRLGIAPLYTSFSDILEAMRRLRQVIVERRYEKYPSEKPAVT